MTIRYYDRDTGEFLAGITEPNIDLYDIRDSCEAFEDDGHQVVFEIE